MASVKRLSPAQEERRLQQAMVKLYRNYATPESAVLFSIPNGVQVSNNPWTLIAEGLCPGAADMGLATSSAMWFIEVKLPARTSWGPKGVIKKPATKQRPDQIAFEASVTALGHRYRVVRSLEEFVSVADEAGVQWRIRPIVLAAPSGSLLQA
jgi:hypothetical protein